MLQNFSNQDFSMTRASLRLVPCLLLSVLCAGGVFTPAEARTKAHTEPTAAATPTAPTKNTDDAAHVAIVVNETAITNSDIAARYGMALLSSGMPDTAETRGRIMPQIIRTLIEEQLQLQEAKRQQIDVSDTEINQALGRVAKENNVPGGDMRHFLTSHGIAARTIEIQAKAGLAWAKLIQRQLRPRVEVSDGEVEEVVNRLRASEGKTEYFINEIFLPVDDAEQESAVHSFADKLMAQIKETGAFGAIARQFSQGAGAPNGGEIGWVQQGTLAPELDAALAQGGDAGGLIGPIKTSKGYHILALRDQRKITIGGDAGTTVRVAQIAHGYTPETQQQVMGEAQAARKQVTGCADLNEKFPTAMGWQVRLTPEQPITALPPALAPLVRNAPIGSPSPLDPQPNGVAFLVVCERVESSSIDRAAIMNKIGSERLENLARSLLRDIKRNAYIDRRI